MSQEEQDLRIDYVELAATDLERVKAFYSAVFGWSFEERFADPSGNVLAVGSDH